MRQDVSTHSSGTTGSRRKIRVLIVDDSISVRRVLSEIVSSDPELEVMATAADPYAASERIREEIPDVIFLDIEMPKMDGLTFLRKIMAQRPIPVVICSSLVAEGSDAFLQALEGGAVDVVMKPRLSDLQSAEDSRMRICDTAKAAARARMRNSKKTAPNLVVEAKLTADALIPPLSPSRLVSVRAAIPSTDPVICIGSSTGGTEALRVVLQDLPDTAPGIVIVQHMPERFTEAFARRLNTMCEMEIKEAANGDAVRPGRVLIAPGGHHMVLVRKTRDYIVNVIDGPHISRHRPSVDILFRSAAQCAGPNASGFILTGMGDDGARGLLEMREMGAYTVAQDEASSVVFGMPKEAIERGAAAKVLPLGRMANEIMSAGTKGRSRTGTGR